MTRSPLVHAIDPYAWLRRVNDHLNLPLRTATIFTIITLTRRRMAKEIRR